MNSGAAFSLEAEQLVARRVTDLSKLSFDQAYELPEAAGEEVVVADQRGRLTVYSQPLRDGGLLVTVQLAFPTVFGLASSHHERGLVFSATGPVRVATADELIRSGG